jgi:hypothetical protein
MSLVNGKGVSMSQLGEIEKMNTAAPDLKKQEQEIRSQVATELPNLSPEAQEAVIQSRLKILFNQNRPTLIQVDLGDNASKKNKENLFE